MASPKRNANRRKFNRQPIDVDDLTSASSFSGIRETIESHFSKPETQDAASEADGAEAGRTVEADPSRPQYVWEPKGVPFSVRLGADLIGRLEKESLDIFRAITNRGSEIGGILLGYVLPGWPTSILVEDYEPVECTYTLGPTYRLSEGEKERLEEALDRRKEANDLVPVGFFRSNTRPTLVLQDDDLELFDEFLPEDHNIFVLAKPYSRKPCQGAIFVREGGKIRTDLSPQEFAFSRAELEKTGALQPGIKVSTRPGRVGPASTSDRVTSISSAGESRRLEPVVPVAPPPEPKPVIAPPAETRSAPSALRIERPESGVKTPAEPKVEPRVEARVEPRIAPRFEPRVEAKVEPRMEPKVEPRVEARVEPRVEPKIEPRVEARVEPRIAPRVEPRVEARVEPRVEPKVEPRVEPRVEAKAEPPVEPKVEPRKPWEKPASLPPRPVIRPPVQSAAPRTPAGIERPLFPPALRGETPVEPKVEPPAPPRFTARIQSRVAPSVQPRIETKLGSRSTPGSVPTQPPRFMARPEAKAPAPPPPVVEAKPTPVVEARLAPKVEPAAPSEPAVRIEPVVQSPAPPRAEAKAEPDVVVRVEPKPEPKTEPAGPRFTKIRPRMQAPPVRTEPRVEPKPQPKPEPKPESSPEITSAPAFGYKEEDEAQGKRRWVLPLVIALLIGGVGSYLVLRPGSRAEPAPAATHAPARPQAVTLVLRTEGSDAGLTVFWDGSAPPISIAPRGRLSIRDGATTKNIDLSPDDLGKGMFQYQPRTDDVTFRLELTDLPHGQNASGVMHVLGARRMGKR